MAIAVQQLEERVAELRRAVKLSAALGVLRGIILRAETKPIPLVKSAIHPLEFDLD